MEDTELYRRACLLSDEVYLTTVRWPSFTRETVGTQFVKSLDSVGANLVEGDGKGPGADAIRFFRIARGSCREMRYWIERSTARRLIDAATGKQWLAEASQVVGMIHGLIRYRQSNSLQTRELPADYDVFAEED
jgi:four helix bundle protein